MALTDKLTAIGNAIREKEGSTGLIPLNDMPARIQALSSGGGDDPVRQSVLALANGTSYVDYVIPAGATKIAPFMFYGQEKLRSLVFEDETKIKSFGQEAFENSSNLQMDRFPSGFNATDIPYGCFWYCSNIKLADGLPAGIKYIYNYAFANCANLQFTTLPEGLTDIYDYAFQYAYSQYASTPPPTMLTFPASLKTISNRAFEEVGLKKIRFLGQPDDINNNAFRNSSITDIYVPWGSNLANTMTSKAPWGATGAQIHYNVSPDEVIA